MLLAIEARRPLMRQPFIDETILNWPQTLGQQVLSIRDDLSISFNKQGRHDVKMGAEYLNVFFYLYNCRPCVGIYDAANSRPPAMTFQ